MDAGVARALEIDGCPPRAHDAKRAAADEAASENRTLEAAAGLDPFFDAVRRTRPDGVVLPNVAWMAFQMGRIAAQLRDTRTPSIAIWRKYPAAGGLLCYGADDPMNRRVDKIDRLLRGEKPGDMPVAMPTHFHLIVNLAAAEAIGVRIAPDVLSRADEVIR